MSTNEELSPGTYPVVARELALGHASTGTPQVAVLLEVNEGKCAGHQIVWYGYLTPGTYERTLDALKALGWDGVGFETMEATVCQGQGVALATLKNETYNGETRLKVDRLGAPGKVDGIAMKDKITADDPRMGQFVAQLDGLLLQYQDKQSKVDQGPGARAMVGNGAKIGPAPRPSGAPSPAADGDDIPF